jgi:hypothetical protein
MSDVGLRIADWGLGNSDCGLGIADVRMEMSDFGCVIVDVGRLILEFWSRNLKPVASSFLLAMTWKPGIRNQELEIRNP